MTATQARAAFEPPGTGAPRADSFGLYVHWPFCLSKCPYCDFNSRAMGAVDHHRWRAAYGTELAHFARRAPGRRLTSIYFGGGTPSLMEPATVAAIIEAAAGHFTLAPDIEITLEANPSTAEAGRFADFRAAGINRLSIGVQALDDRALSFLGRGHSAAEAKAAVALAARLFDRFSFDLICARPGQTQADWAAELAQGLAMAGDHLSLYQLTIEDGTAFAPAYQRGDFVLPEDDQAAALYGLTQEMCDDSGLPAYEVSNHARPGGESRHNLTYWRGGDYVGIGPGAHGRLNRTALAQRRDPGAWLDSVEKDSHGTAEEETLDARTRAEELVMMGLRLNAGIDAEIFAAAAGLPLWQVIDPAGLARMEQGGFVIRTADGLRATPSGLLMLNGVTGALLG
ncbi:MAG: coproporphyrinogen III oxidase [Alphaproteobacteria bacterium]|nr:coproporphyrinogen III oxidase [Alphaproteobacteria bacterium]